MIVGVLQLERLRDRRIMGFSLAPVIVFTVLWVVVGIVLPFVVPKGPNRGCV